MKTQNRLNPEGLNYVGARVHPDKIRRFPVSYCSAALKRRIVKAAERKGVSVSTFVLNLIKHSLKLIEYGSR